MVPSAPKKHMIFHADSCEELKYSSASQSTMFRLAVLTLPGNLLESRISGLTQTYLVQICTLTISPGKKYVY